MIVTLFGRILQFGISFLSIRFMTELLSPTEVGRVSLIVSGTAIFSLFFINPVGMFYNRRLHSWYKDGHIKKYFYLYVGYIFFISVIAALIICISQFLGIGLMGLSLGWILILVCGSIFFNTIFQTLVPSLNMIGRRKIFVFISLCTLIIGLLISLVLNYVLYPSAEFWLLGAIISQIGFSLIAYFIFFNNKNSIIGEYSFKSLLSTHKLIQVSFFCIPIAISVLLQWMQIQGYRFFLAEHFGLGELGLYFAGYGIAASLVGALETITNTWFQPEFYRMLNSKKSEDQNEAWSMYANRMIPISLLGVSLIIAASLSLPRIMLGPAFQNTSQFLIIGALTEWSRMMVGVFGLHASGQMNTKKLIAPNIVGVLVTYVIFFLMIDYLGIMAAPVGACLGSIAIVILLYWFSYASDGSANIDILKFLLQACFLGVLSIICIVLQLIINNDMGIFESYIATLIYGCIWMIIFIVFYKKQHLNFLK